MAKKKAAGPKPKAKPAAAPKKPPTKSEFLRKALARNPGLEYETILSRWAKAGHPGSISKSLFMAIRGELGIRTVWEWVDTGPPRSIPAASLPPAPSGAEQVHALGEVFRFRVVLQDVEPEVWRRIEVQDGTLDKLHEAIQTAMGWTNSHLHQFHIDGVLYGPRPPAGYGDFDTGTEDSAQFLLNTFLPRDDSPYAFGYEYDFGDGWMHDVEYEGRAPLDPGQEYPRCLDGARACPPEDCGGPWGYEELLEILADPEHPEHKERKAWVGGKLDPEKFNAAAATRAMRMGLPRPW